MKLIKTSSGKNWKSIKNINLAINLERMFLNEWKTRYNKMELLKLLLTPLTH